VRPPFRLPGTLPAPGTLSRWGTLLAATALIAGCGSDHPVPPDDQPPVPEDLECPPGSIDGAGSSAQENAMQVWIAGYQSACEATVYYDAIGSGGGRSQFIDGAVSFAGTDAALDEEETAEAVQRCGGAEPVNLPAYAVPIAVAFNLEGIDSLNLTPQAIAGIFNQDITRWDDEAIAADNPDTDLPDLPIQTVSRSDESGTTENFTEYLHQAAAEDWPHEPDGQWPIVPVEAGQGNSGVAAAIEGGQGMIGYVEASHVGHMSTAAVGVGEEFVEVGAEAAGRVLALAEERPGNSPHDLALELDYATEEPDTYPIVLVTYEVACLAYDDAEEVALLQDFLHYVVSDEGQHAASEEIGSAIMPEEMRERLEESIDVIAVH
jgi:phosphate transport system substrate-binding protein